MLTEEFILVFLAVLQVINWRPLFHMRKHRLGCFSFAFLCMFLSDLCSLSRVMFCEEDCA